MSNNIGGPFPSPIQPFTDSGIHFKGTSSGPGITNSIKRRPQRSGDPFLGYGSIVGVAMVGGVAYFLPPMEPTKPTASGQETNQTPVPK